jgi:hypothetical protein
MSAIGTAACPAAGRYARHRATVRWRGGGDRHEAIWCIVALGALLGMFGGVVTATPALAGGRGDGWELFPFGSGTVTGFCAFPVFIGVPAQNAFQKILTSPPGTTILLLNGSLKMSFTNENTGKTITENVTGSGKAIVNPDDSLSIRQEGHLGLITLEAADAERFGLPPLAVIGGVLFEEVTPEFTYTSVSMQGHILVDICAALS